MNRQATRTGEGHGKWDSELMKVIDMPKLLQRCQEWKEQGIQCRFGNMVIMESDGLVMSLLNHSIVLSSHHDFEYVQYAVFRQASSIDYLLH